MKDEKDYYLTTAITYTSGKPHIGNTYEIILADAIARFKRQEGYNVRFQTGTDEHGQKIEIKAKEAGIALKNKGYHFDLAYSSDKQFCKATHVSQLRRQ